MVNVSIVIRRDQRRKKLSTSPSTKIITDTSPDLNRGGVRWNYRNKLAPLERTLSVWYYTKRMDSTLDDFVEIYKNSVKSRYLDERLLEYYQKKLIKRTLFSGIGAEVGPSIIVKILQSEDYLLPAFRGYAAVLAKGISPEEIIAEVMDKKTGLTQGLGDVGSFYSSRLNIPGYSTVLGTMFAVGIGLAFSIAQKNEKRILVQFFGEGEATRNTFGGALNLAALWRLPVLFICLNNDISIETKFSEMSATATMAERGCGYGVESETITEKEPRRLFTRAKEIVEHVRDSRRPFLLEVLQKRFEPHSSRYSRDHALSNELFLGDEDPLHILEKTLKELGISESQLASLKAEAIESIQRAFSKTEKEIPLSQEEFLSFIHE